MKFEIGDAVLVKGMVISYPTEGYPFYGVELFDGTCVDYAEDELEIAE